MPRALLVCNSTYPSDPASLAELRGAQMDGVVMWSSLTDAASGIFGEGDVRVLFERTSNEIMRAIEQLMLDAEPAETVLLYFSGHGQRDGQELMLCARDTETRLLASTAVSSSVINRLVERSKASNVVIILDCCFSGAFKGSVDAAADRKELADEFKGNGRYVLTATRAFDLAPDAKGLGHPSPFTASLAEALRTGAPDLDGDGWVEIADVHRVVHEALPALDPQQRFSGSGTLPIARRQRINDAHAGSPAPARNTSDSISVHRARVEEISIAGRPLSLRKSGDLTNGDLHLWKWNLVIALLGLALVTFSYFRWPLETTQNAAGEYSEVISSWRYLAMGAGISACIVAVAALVDGWFTRRLTRDAPNRRAVLKGLDSGVLAPTRRLRWAGSLGIAVTIVATLGQNNLDPLWTAGLCTLALLPLAIPFDRLRLGDAAYAAGALLLALSPFLPDTSGQTGIGLQNSLGVASLLLGVILLGLWSVGAPRVALFLGSGVAGLLGLRILYFPMEIVTPYASAAGALACLLAVWLGCGSRLSADDVH